MTASSRRFPWWLGLAALAGAAVVGVIGAGAGIEVVDRCLEAFPEATNVSGKTSYMPPGTTCTVDGIERYVAPGVGYLAFLLALGAGIGTATGLVITRSRVRGRPVAEQG